jgi:hypothetical protein
MPRKATNFSGDVLKGTTGNSSGKEEKFYFLKKDECKTIFLFNGM